MSTAIDPIVAFAQASLNAAKATQTRTDIQTASQDASAEIPETEQDSDTDWTSEICQKRDGLIEDGKLDSEIAAILLNEFEDIDERDANLLIKSGRKKFADEIGIARQSEEDAKKTAMEAVDKRIEAEREADKHLVEKYQIAGRLDKAIDANDKERAAKIIRDFEDSQAEPEENFDDAAEEPFPECPIFPGALTDLAKALYPSLPLEFKQFGLIRRDATRVNTGFQIGSRSVQCPPDQ